jgi:predicted TIM-barrel fold metal-dependent hydrolase
MGTLVLGGVFERHPRLRVVCVEADAGWVPHFMYRMDHAWKRHRNWLPPGQALSKLPSSYFAEGIYTTFQDDWVAFRCADMMNWRRLMWANDFPHSDSTWPWSQAMLAEHTTMLTDAQRRAILCDNVAELLSHRSGDVGLGVEGTQLRSSRPDHKSWISGLRQKEDRATLSTLGM